MHPARFEEIYEGAAPGEDSHVGLIIEALDALLRRDRGGGGGGRSMAGRLGLGLGLRMRLQGPRLRSWGRSCG